MALFKKKKKTKQYFNECCLMASTQKSLSEKCNPSPCKAEFMTKLKTKKCYRHGTHTKQPGASDWPVMK